MKAQPLYMQIHNNYIPKTLKKSNTAIKTSNNLNALEKKYLNNSIYFIHKQNINNNYIKIHIIEFTKLSKSDMSHKRMEKNLKNLKKIYVSILVFISILIYNDLLFKYLEHVEKVKNGNFNDFRDGLHGQSIRRFGDPIMLHTKENTFIYANT